MEYCCHIWAGALSCYLELWDKLQKWTCRSFTCCLPWSFGSSLKCSQLKSFLYIGITLVDVYLNWLNWFHVLILGGGLLVILIDCMMDVYVNSLFPYTARRLWNSLPIECLPLTYDLNGSNCRINRHLLTVGSF